MKSLVSLDLNGYRVGKSSRERGHIVRSLLETWFEAMTRTNMVWLALHPKIPNLYKTGVRYKRDPEKNGMGITELWLDAPAILRRGYDDCEGLASYLAAEMRVRKNPSVGGKRRPFACVRLKTTRYPGLLHAIVFDPQTREVFDPSKALGMGSKEI